MTPLTMQALLSEARDFAVAEGQEREPNLYGVTDGKAVGTYLERKFRTRLSSTYAFTPGNSAAGIDLPDLLVDIKTTSITQPQSSCPFKSARQKVYGLGYSLLVFVYQKTDDPEMKVANLNVQHVIFVDKGLTADYQTTYGLTQILGNNGNVDDIIAFLGDRMLPVDDIQATELAEEIMKNPPSLGYLTISNALQWRLQYSRVIALAGTVDGLNRVL